MDFRDIVPHWPHFCDEWEDFRKTSQSLMLAPFPSNLLVHVLDLLLFVDTRLRRSSHIQHDHWLCQARKACLCVAAFLAEVSVFADIERDSKLDTRLEVSAVFGKSQQRRAHRCVHSRMKMLRILRETHGSDNAILSALSSGGHGKAAELRSLRNSCYTDEAREAFSQCNRVAPSYDGGTHGGNEVQVGVATDVGSHMTCYLKPKVWCPLVRFPNEEFVSFAKPR